MEVKEEARRARRVLEKRAEILARVPHVEQRSADEIEVAVCTSASEAFGFPVHLLREIVPLPIVTPLPFAPDWLVGIAQVRGTLLGVFDLSVLAQAKGESRPEHLVVVEAPQGPVGFTVDRVLACRHVSPAKLQASSFLGSERRATLGVTPDLCVVLDVQALLSLPELVIE